MRVHYEKLADHLEEKEAALKNALDELNAKVNPVTVVGWEKVQYLSVPFRSL